MKVTKLNVMLATLIVVGSMILGTTGAVPAWADDVSPPVISINDGTNPLSINQSNLSIGAQTANVTGWVAVEQTILQDSINFNLILENYAGPKFDPTPLFKDLNLSKIIPLPKPTDTDDTPDPNGPKLVEQTIVQIGVNVNETDARPQNPTDPGIILSQINQLNLDLAGQDVIVNGRIGNVLQTVLQNALNFDLIVDASAASLMDASTVNKAFDDSKIVLLEELPLPLDFLKLPDDLGDMPASFVDQTIVQVSLNFNILLWNTSQGVDPTMPADDPNFRKITQQNFQTANQNINTTSLVPEPGSLVPLGIGLPGLLAAGRRKKKE